MTRTLRSVVPLSALALVACASTMLAACPETPDGDAPDAADAGIIVIRFDAGPPPDPVDGGSPDAGPINSVVVVTSLTPPSGPLHGGNRTILEGENFAPESQVFFADVQATDCLFLTTRRMSCEVPPGVTAGPVDVRVENELGVGLLEGGYTYFSPITLRGITPSTGSTDGGTAITLVGESFHEDMIVLVGGRRVVDLDVQEGGARATALLPPGSPGRVDVTAIDAFGRSTLPLAFTYVADLSIDRIDPAIVDEAALGSAVVELSGRGFAEDDGIPTAAAVDSVPAARDNLISDERLRVVVPAVGSGSHDVTVVRGDVTAVLQDGLVVLPAPTGAFDAVAVFPRRVDVGGGDVITVLGEGFTARPITAVTFAGAAGADVTVVDDRHLTVTAPAGVVGPADVVVVRDDGSTAAIPQGVLYQERLTLRAVSPSSGPAAGPATPADGTLTLTGTGFTAGIVVTLGGVACADVVVTSPTALTCTAPAGAAGLVDVVVTGADGQRARLDDAFLFEDEARVLGVKPSRGAYTGDVFVTIAGSGFASLQRLATPTTPLVALFGGVPGDPRELTVVSDNLITCRTPLTPTGVLDVTVALATITVDDRGVPSVALDPERQATATRVFTAFDPTSILGGTRGGPIDGAVYVTALDAFTGLPVPNLLAFTGSGGVPTAADITHFPFGQATLSGPDIVGPQTVSIVGDGYEHSTLVDVNATEITLYLLPIGGGGPPGNGQPPPPPPPAQIRGRVFGFAKEFFDPAALGPDELAVAVVTTTGRDEFSPIPDPGGNPNVFEEGGEYFIANARPGRLALVALAGIFNIVTNEFRLRQMGVRREVFSQRGVTLVDQDIELTIPLDRVVDLSLPDAPLDFEIEDLRAQFGNGPDVTRVIPFIQLGGEGAISYTTAIDGDRNHALDDMPDLPGEMLTFVAGAYSTTGRNLITDVGTANLTANSITVTGNGTFWDETDPFTGQPLLLGKIFVAELPDGRRFASDILGVDGGDLRLRDRAPVTASELAYHIGDAGLPSSEVIQDGVGDLRGGVLIQPVLGIPEVISPQDNGVLEQRTLRWRPAPGEQPTIHVMYVFDPFDFAQVWSFYVEGSRTKVPVPVVPDVSEFLPVLPQQERALPEDFIPPSDLFVGGLAWQHEAIFVPGLVYDNWSLLDIGTRGRRAWTTNLKIFVHGRDE